MRAHAAASGEEVVFGAGQPSPRLVARELTHVVQQRLAGGGVQQKPRVSPPGDAAEREADRVGAAVAKGGAAQVSAAAVGTHGDGRERLGNAVDRAGAAVSGAALGLAGGASRRTRAPAGRCRGNPHVHTPGTGRGASAGRAGVCGAARRGGVDWHGSC